MPSTVDHMMYVVRQNENRFEVINLKEKSIHSSWSDSREALRVARDLNRQAAV